MHRRSLALENAIVVAFLVASGVAAVRADRWTALHLLLLGGLGSAVLAWGEHFAATVMRAPNAPRAVQVARAVTYATGVTGVVLAVRAGHRGWTVASALVVATAVAQYAWRLRATTRRVLGGRFAMVVETYAVAAGCLLLGGLVGVLLATGATHDGATFRAWRLAHLHLTVLGFLGLTVLATELTLWPTVLHTKMAEDTERSGLALLTLGGPGVLVAAAGFAWQVPPVALAGLVTYGAAVALTLRSFADAARHRRPENAAAWLLAGGACWLVAIVAVDVVAVVRSATPVGADRTLARLTPMIAVGFGLQTLTGALTHLLPMLWGRGAHGYLRLQRALTVGWWWRVPALNAGALLLALPVRTAPFGALLVAAAVVPFVGGVPVAYARQEDLTRGRRWAVAAGSLALLAAAGTLVATGRHSRHPVPGTPGVTMTLGEMFVRPAEVTVAAGTDVTIEVTNTGAIPHNLTVKGTATTTGDLAPGRSALLRVGPVTRPLVLVCTIPGHEQAGMRSRLAPGNR